MPNRRQMHRITRKMQGETAGVGTPRLRAASTPARPDHGASVKSRYTVQSLVVGLRILESLAKSSGLKGVTELARDLNTSKWVIFRHLHTLCEQGFAVRDPVTEKYEAGRRLQSLKDALPSRYVWAHRARDEMIRLRQEVGLTVSIATTLEDRSGVIVVDVESGGGNVLYTLKLGAIFDFHSSAHGKIALAFGDNALLDLAIGRGLRRVAPRTIVSADALRREIRRIREAGWAAAAEEAEANMNALVAPVFSSHGIYEGSIGVFGPLEQILREPSPALVRSVMTAARRVSERLGAGQAAMRRR